MRSCAKFVLAGVLMMTARAASADWMNPCPLGSSNDTIERCTETLASPNLSEKDKPYAYWLRGWRYYQRGRYPDALNDFNAAIDLIPGFDPLSFVQNALNGLLGPKISPAQQEEQNRTTDLVNPFGDFYVGKAATLTALGQFQEAISVTKQAEGQFKSNRMVGYARTFAAIAYERMGDWSDAEKLYREAAELDPESADTPLYDLALMDLKLDKKQDIAAIVEVALRRNPKDRKPALLLYSLGLSAPSEKNQILPDTTFMKGNYGPDVDDAIGDYFADRVNIDTVMKSADDGEGGAYPDVLCEIHFFLGARALSTDKSEAKTQFEAAIATGETQMAEYSASEALLKSLKGN